MIESLARARLPAPLEGRVTMREKLQNRRLILQDKTSPWSATRKSRRLELRDGRPFRREVGQLEDVPLFPRREPVLRRRDDLVSVGKSEIGVEVIERTFELEPHRRLRPRKDDAARVKMVLPQWKGRRKGRRIESHPFAEQRHRLRP